MENKCINFGMLLAKLYILANVSSNYIKTTLDKVVIEVESLLALFNWICYVSESISNVLLLFEFIPLGFGLLWW